MINIENRIVALAPKVTSRPWRKLLLNLVVVAVAVCALLVGAATMPLLGTAPGTAKPVVAALFGLHILTAPALLVLSHSRLSNRQIIATLSVAGCVLFYLGGMLLG